jgi:hypothetical protein
VPLACLAVLASAALLGGVPAHAKSTAAGAGRVATLKSHHNCRCAERCRGAACCCKHDRPAETAVPEPTAPATADPSSTSPCFAAIPCDGGTPLPTTSGPLVRIVDAANLGISLFLPARVTARLAQDPSERPAAVVLARLEKPPEGELS